MSCGWHNIYCFLFGARLASWQLNCQTTIRMIKPVYLAKQYRNSANELTLFVKRKEHMPGHEGNVWRHEHSFKSTNTSHPRSAGLPARQIITSTTYSMRIRQYERWSQGTSQWVWKDITRTGSHPSTCRLQQSPTNNGQTTWPHVFAVKWSNYVTSCICS